MNIQSALCLAALCAALGITPAPAQTVTSAVGQSTTSSPASSGVIQPLWPQAAPGALGNAPEDIPTLTIYLPAQNTQHMGIVVAPGGGYNHLATAKEGDDVAHWLNAHGIAAFVLQYRLGPKYHHPIELGDAQRALRLVRSRSAEYGIDKLGMMGFSAGGHLTATAGTHFDAGNPAQADPIERESSRPDFLVLGYAVITLQKPYTHAGSLKYLLGDNPDAATVNLLSDELQVTAQTPPTFLFATSDDPVVPVVNSELFYQALLKAGVPAEMHLFQHGPHGTGLAQSYPGLKLWPDLLWAWLQAR
jgi:acetyl esterase/lipase